MLGRVFEQDRAALPVGDEMQAHRRVGDAEFLGDHVAFQEVRSCPPYFFGQVMPIQPLAPTRRLKSRLCESPWPRPMRIEGAGGDLLGQERAHLLRAAPRIRAAGGSGRIEAAVIMSIRSARRHQRPEIVGTAARDMLAELHRPIAFVAEVVAPGEHAQREAVQHVLLVKPMAPKT